MVENTKSNELMQIMSDLQGVSMTPEVLASDDFASKYTKLCEFVEQATKIKEVIDAGIMEIVKTNYLETGDSSVKNGEYIYTYVPATEAITLDSKKLKEEQPEIYAKYAKKTSRKDSIRKKKITNPVKSETSKIDPKKAIDLEDIL